MTRLERYLFVISLFVVNVGFIPSSNAQVPNKREIEFNFVNTSRNENMFAPVTPITSYSNVLKRVSLNDLLGNSTVPFEVIVPPSGVNISLIGSDWQIKKLWLDSPGFSLDFDGCLSNSSKQSQQSQGGESCKSSAAQVIHIVPESDSNLPYSMLTMIVSSSSDNQNEKRKLLIIRLKKGQSSDYTAYNYEIYDSYKSSSSFSSSALVSKKLNIIESIKETRAYSRGIQVALDRKFIDENGFLHRKLKDFLVNLRQGETIDNSASKAGLDLQIIEKIFQLGT